MSKALRQPSVVLGFRFLLTFRSLLVIFLLTRRSLLVIFLLRFLLTLKSRTGSKRCPALQISATTSGPRASTRTYAWTAARGGTS